MSDILLKVTIEKKWHIKNFDFQNLKSLPSTHTDIFEFSNLLQLKNQKSESKTVSFLLFWFWRELICFKVKESMLFVEQKYNFNRNKKELQIENSTYVIQHKSCALAHIRSELKVKLVSWSLWKKKLHFWSCRERNSLFDVDIDYTNVYAPSTLLKLKKKWYLIDLP